jgi:uncharacterized membrane protein
MPSRLEHEREVLAKRLDEGDPWWPAQLAIAVVILLNLGFSDRITIGPTWLLPAIEGVLLIVLILTTPRRVTTEDPRQRRLALTLIALVSASNIVSLGLLVHYLVNGGHAGGRPLIGSGALLWINNVLLFAVWYWEMDRGGPVARMRGDEELIDFQFPQMENPELAPENWRPGFADYLYVSLTNATAFSPTDTMPLTISTKCVMGIQAIAALVTVGLVIARAVNILGS